MSRVWKSTSSNGHCSLRINLKEQANDTDKIVEALKQSNTFDSVLFWADSRTKHEHLQLLLSAIESYNRTNSTKIETLKIIVFYDNLADNEEENIGSLEKFSNLQSPTKYFKFSATYSDDIDNLFQELAAVLRSGTNFNQISIRDLTFAYDHYLPLGNGFDQFCTYFRDNKEQLLSLRLQDFDFGFEGYKQTIQLIQNSHALTDLELSLISFLSKHDSSLYDAIVNRNLKKLKLRLMMVWELCVDLIKNSQTLEELTVYSTDRDGLNRQYNQRLKEALKATHSLKSFFLREIFLQPDQLNFLEENESLTTITCRTDDRGAETIQKISEITGRNIKLQNERVKSMIVLLYNIARSSRCNDSSLDHSWSALPNDIWPLIMTRVKYPGVTLDFGPIAKLIFKDSAIRRVIIE